MVNGVSGKGGMNPAQMAQQIFQGIDSEGKGYIDKSQLQEDLKKHGITDQTKIDEICKTMDADSDGKITQSEFTTGMKSMKPPHPNEEMKSMLSELGNTISASDLKSLFDKITSSNSSSKTRQSDRAKEMFSKIDTEGKGYIDKSQLEEDMKNHGITDQTKIDEMYKAMDADEDGKITESEFASGMEKMKPQGGAHAAGGPPLGPPPGGPPPADSSSSTSSTDSDSSDDTTIDLSQLSSDQQQTLKSLLEMMQQANGSNNNMLKGMFFDTAR